MRLKIARAALCVWVAWALAASGVAAQSFAAFDFRPQPDLVVPAFSDTDVGALLSTLDRLLTPPAESNGRSEPAATVLWQFARRLQTGRLSESQESRVVAHLDTIARSHPGLAAAVAAPRRMIRDLTVGKKAPDIAGTDLDGRSFRLSDYREKVVVLVFSADWCGICRAQAPYERFLLDRYARWPFALLGVQTGGDREAARQAQAIDPLSHRSWWDAPRSSESNGPIATAWNVIGWPATYVIDGQGIIRFIDLREEDLLKAVRQLVDAQVDRDARLPHAR